MTSWLQLLLGNSNKQQPSVVLLKPTLHRPQVEALVENVNPSSTHYNNFSLEAKKFAPWLDPQPTTVPDHLLFI
ncbi:uncharacterized protein LOC144618843 isoform X2 [Crassostrea virginica]